MMEGFTGGEDAVTVVVVVMRKRHLDIWPRELRLSQGANFPVDLQH